MKVIGITGGVGAGKSEVLKFLSVHKSTYVCQADEVAKSQQQKGTACLDAITAHFGEGILTDDGELDRKALGEIVFHNKAALEALNAIVHPAVEERIKELMQEERKKGTQLFFLEAAILLEAGYDRLFCDEVWYIYADDAVRKARLKAARGYSDEKVEAMFRAQMSKDEYEKYCDRTIDNSRSFDETRTQLLQILEKLD